jgi:hypothetical protein
MGLRQVDVMSEGLWAFLALVWDLVLGDVNGPSSLVVSLSMVVDLFESQIDTATINGVS